MLKRALLLVATTITGAPASPDQNFSCRNEVAEIRCEGGECQLETDSFTPMHLTRTGRVITLCAYSECWEGAVSFDRSRSGVQFLQSRMKLMQPKGEAGRSLMSVMFSKADQTAQISWNGFFGVLECRTRSAT